MNESLKSILKRHKKAKSAKKLVAIRIPGELHQMLEALSKETGASFTDVVIQTLIRGLEK
ncbi:MAG: hypothetical protein A4S09_01310 [Proteobacteria bacterium SG_bin7]|nr:MAG: hypothetical protein A4S09_01310 [Proteobacteria bacterium SG_bin7]